MLILQIFIVGLGSGVGGVEGLFGCWGAVILGIVRVAELKFERHHFIL